MLGVKVTNIATSLSCFFSLSQSVLIASKLDTNYSVLFIYAKCRIELFA
jgi:hypothetical protein